MNIKILVCYHKQTPIIANSILQPILLGAENANYALKKSLQDSCKKHNVSLFCDNMPSAIGGGQK